MASRPAPPVAGKETGKAPAWERTPIGDVAVLGRTARPSQSQHCRWQVVPIKDGKILAEIADEFGLIRYRKQVHGKAGDATALSWDGKDSSGQAVKADVYYLKLSLLGPSDTLVHSPTWSSGGEMVIAKNTLTEVQDSGAVRVDFELDRPSRVSLNFGVLGGAHIHCPVWMSPFDAGKHSLQWKWDGESAGLDLGKLSNMVHVVKGYALPHNALIVAEGEASDFRARKSQAPPLERLLRPVATQARFPVSELLSPAFTLAVKNPEGFTPDGIPIVKGKVKVEIDMPKPERLRIARQRYELMMFVNFFGVFEDEEASLPFTFEWDSGTHRPGRHYLTCNISTYADAFGVATIPVVVEKAEEKP